jgi:hypothetical protein
MKLFSLRLFAFALLGVAGIALVAAPTAALAGGRVGGGQNRNANGGICKSGKRVPDTTACKENGGKS